MQRVPLWTTLTLLVAPLLLSGSELQRFESIELHMGTLVKITLYAADPDSASGAFTAAFGRIKELDAILSDYEPESELMRVCRQASKQPVRVSGDLFYVLDEALRVSKETDGAFDVSLGPIIRLWRKARLEKRLPAQTDLEEAAGFTGYRKVVLDRARHTVFLKSPHMLLDLGGIAKGYAADAALRIMRARGITRALVAVSGDIAIGDPPPGQPGWRIGIEPSDKFSRVAVLKNTAVSTSGDAEQFVDIGNQRYSHIIDPKTRLGVTSRIGLTIVAINGIAADSLATAVIVLGAERGLEFIARQTDTAALIVTMTGEVFESKFVF